MDYGKYGCAICWAGLKIVEPASQSIIAMIRMEIESENDTPSYPTPYFTQERPTPPSHNLSLDEMRTLKKKQ